MTSQFVKLVAESDTLPPLPSDLAMPLKYEPDRFQRFAIQAIEERENVLITAKTGSGKTFVGEYQIAKSLSRGGRVFYTTPVKSLSNQKFHDLKELFGDRASVGIMTGDIKFRPDAQILVMTTEILRNLLYKRGTATEKVGTTSLLSLEGVDAVVFDEVHYINDPDRGHVWEETLMLLPSEIRLILLSATLAQPVAFAEWLGECKRVRVWVISTQWRAVPLEHGVIDFDGKISILQDAKEVLDIGKYAAWVRDRHEAVLAHDKFQAKVRDARRGGQEGPVAGKTRPKSFEHELNTCLDKLSLEGNLPCIVFQFSRAGCEKLAAKTTGTFLDSSDAAKVAHIWDFHLSRFKESLQTSPQYYGLRDLAMRGIAYHHSGVLPFLKEILEILFSKGLIKVLYATETFAVGINMPTKTVIFTALEKFTDGQIRPLTTAEYLQMAGRAGRRGKDTRGLVLYLPQRDPVSSGQYQSILKGSMARFGSRMNFHYDFVLKLLNSGRQSQELVEGSYWWRLEQESLGARKLELEALERRVGALAIGLTVAQKEDCKSYEELVLQKTTSQNAKRKAAIRALDRWQEEHRGPQWERNLETYRELCRVEKEVEQKRQEYALAVQGGADVPEVRCRLRLLEECGYADSVSSNPPELETKATSQGQGLTAKGRLASEVNEGHPFLMTSLFLRLCDSLDQWDMQDLLCLLAVFLGEAGDRDDVAGNKVPSDLIGVSAFVKAELRKMDEEAADWCKREAAVGLPYDPKFWSLSTEWVEPVSRWISAAEGSANQAEGRQSAAEGSANQAEGVTPLTLGALAAEFELFEGNVLKALLKLAGLVEEVQALASLTGAVEVLRRVEEARALVLRDVVIAESLYLRI